MALKMRRVVTGHDGAPATSWCSGARSTTGSIAAQHRATLAVILVDAKPVEVGGRVLNAVG